MLFNSLTFLLFALLFYAVWAGLTSQTGRLAWLTLMSFIFYGWADWRFIFLLLTNGLVDFYAALLIERDPQHKRRWLILSLSSNIGCLATFKYLGFFTSSLTAVVHALGGGHVPIVQLALPIGISFYTFHSMSYTIDVYRGELRPTHSLLHFLAFLSMFPHLVAGPILRASYVLPQLKDHRRATEAERWDGLKMITRGFFLKVVIADNLSPVVNEAFNQAVPAASLPFWWLIITIFAMQIYCDFAGYSSIAIGLAKWMGITFLENFRHPYVSRSVREFWTRWHISLSTWLRDYLYIPLGGSRGSTAAGLRNMWITMLISGLWHGAAWTFVIWGALHALYLTLERLLRWPERLSGSSGGRFLSWVLLIVMIWIGWAFFRSESLAQAAQIVAIMFNVRQWNLAPVAELASNSSAVLALTVGVLMELAVVLERPMAKILTWRPAPQLAPIAIALALTACVYLRGPGSAFIYFQF